MLINAHMATTARFQGLTKLLNQAPVYQDWELRLRPQNDFILKDFKKKKAAVMLKEMSLHWWKTSFLPPKVNVLYNVMDTE